MRIVTQDRMRIVDTDGCDIIFGTDGEILLRRYAPDRIRDTALGIYKTREREQQVFDLLVQAFGQIYRRDFYEMPAE